MADNTGQLSINNWVDDPRASFTCSASVISGLGLGNLALPSPEDNCRVMSTNAYIRVDLGAVRTINLLVMRGSPYLNYFTSTDTVRWRADAASPSSYSALNTDYIPHGVEGVMYNNVWQSYGYSAYFSLAGFSARYLEFAWNAPSLINGYVDFGRMWAGDTKQIGNGLIQGESSSFDDSSVTEWSPKTGRAVVNPGASNRRITFGSDAIGAAPTTNSARQWLDNVAKVVGTRRQVAFVRNPDELLFGREVILGQFDGVTKTDRANYPYATLSQVIKENL